METAIKALREGRVSWLEQRGRALYRIILTGKEGIPAVILGILSLIIAVDLYLFSQGRCQQEQ